MFVNFKQFVEREKLYFWLDGPLVQLQWENLREVKSCFKDKHRNAHNCQNIEMLTIATIYLFVSRNAHSGRQTMIEPSSIFAFCMIDDVPPKFVSESRGSWLSLKLLHICARLHAFSVNAKHFWLASKLYIIPCSPCDESDIEILHDSQRLVLAKLICPCLLILNAMVLLHWLEFLHRKLCHLVPPGFRFCGLRDFLCIKLNVFSWSLVQQLWWSGWKSHRLASLHTAW